MSQGLGRFNPYPEYKDSGVEWLGRIPSRWHLKRLKHCINVNPGRKELVSLSDDLKVTFVPMDAIGEYGGLSLESSRSLGIVREGYTFFRNGDVLVAKITPCFENGKGALAAGLESGIGIGTTELIILRARECVENRFLMYVTFSYQFRSLGAAEMYGASGQKRVPDQFVRDLYHPLPPRGEQQAIAAFLDNETAKIDALIAKKERLIELIQEKRAALITHAVTKGLNPGVPLKESKIDWLGTTPAHWPVSPVYSRYWVQLGKMLDEKRITGENLRPYLRNVDVQWDQVNIEDLPQMDFTPREQERYRLRPGDLLVCEGGEVGRTAVWRDELKECCYQKALHRVRLISWQEHPRYFYYLMNMLSAMSVFRIEGNPNTIDHLTADRLRHYRLPGPPVSEQRHIAEQLDAETSRIERLIERVREAINKIQEYRTALISSAVTGEIDIRPYAIGAHSAAAK